MFLNYKSCCCFVHLHTIKMCIYVSGWFLVAVSWTQDVFCILDGSHHWTWEEEQEYLPTVFSGTMWLICSQQSCCAPLFMGGSGNRVAALHVCLTQPVLKNKGCIYMQAQCHGCHSAGLQWAFGAQMSNFILNNSSRQPGDPSQLTGSFAGFRGDRSTGSTWNIRKGKITENSRGSLTFASSLPRTGSGMLRSQQRDTFLQFLSVLATQHTTFHMHSHRDGERKKDIVWLLSILACTGAQILRTEAREITAALMYL